MPVGVPSYRCPVTATALPSGLSFEQFVELLDQDEYKNAELIDGQVVVSTPSWLHQRILTNLLVAIGNWIAAGRGRGEVTFNPAVRISHNRAYLPDLAWYREERLAGDGPALGSPPDVAVEVLSRSTQAFEQIRKRADHARIGVRELWLISTSGPSVLKLRNEGAEFVVAADLGPGERIASPLPPGLSIAIGGLAERQSSTGG